MQAGRLTESIEIYHPVYEINEFGEKTETYMLSRKTRALVLHNNGNRTVSNDEIVHNYTKTFKVRRYISLFENFQIKYNGQQYRIISIDDNRQANEKTITAELINE